MLKNLLNSSIFCASCLLLQANLVSAAEVHQLDETLVPVESRSLVQQKKAISIGLREVILKNSGSKASIAHPSVKAKMRNPSSLLSQFGYQEVDGELFLQVNFDHQRIIKLLRDAHLPVWGKQRPLTLIWLVEDDAESKQIINDGSVLDSRKLFQSVSESKGVPVLFPVMDLDDNMKVNIHDIRGKFVEPVASASQRYQADYFVIASMDTRGDSVKYNFALYPKSSGETTSTPLTSKSKVVHDLDTAVHEIISAVSEFYVGRYAIADSGSALDSYVTFIDITELKQLVEIEKYFKQLSAVKSVQLTQLQGTSAKYKLDLFGTENDLRRLMKLEPRVRVIDSAIHEAQTDDGFDVLPDTQVQGPEYRWRG
ncbi:DUF2066 domain-containing protein [Shewanella violacea]|uniref:DUF2066 domain-containing protein n=1 Tax=Shewanella violacea (strain JCM 10179 / CIP 106290 / LMG 19151 / DSS12) TaxID=637905 RepID=D4ZJL1_SHEVD|nr:DUF2066 domain-containing protein [Shewanella violacea]BAJ01860.1 conserved hypothetical protein [Shewanella violacea DSS12]